MTSRIFATAQDAENAFYDALERGDLDVMMEVWAEDEEIVCVHPGGMRLNGQDQVRESWRQIFAGPAMRVEISQQVIASAVMAAVHSVHESVTVATEQPVRGTVISTNVYLRTAVGWRMIVHHASPLPGAAEAPRDVPKTLH